MTAVPHACATWVTDLRALAGIALLALVFLLEGPARWLGLIGLVPLATAAFGLCPAYALSGLSTCPMESKRT